MCFLFLEISAQQTYTVITQFKEGFCESSVAIPNTVTSIEELNVELEQWKAAQIINGFLLSSIDTTLIRNDSIFLHLFCGEHYEINSLQVAGDTLQYLNEQRLTAARRDIENNGLPSLDVLKQNIVTHYENNGYPFTTVVAKPEQDEVSELFLQIDPGLEISIDSIIVHSNSTISQHLIERIINYSSGDLYREDRIREIDQRLSSTGYLKQKSNPQASFIANKAKLHLFVIQDKRSRFDVLLGLTREESRDKATITGKGEIDLLSAFGKGERLFLRYENLINNFKQVEAQVAFPFILQMPFGVLGEMNIDIRDTVLRNTKFKYGISYQLRGNQSFTAYFEDQKIRNLSIDSNRLLQGILPNSIDANRYLFGGTFTWRNTNRLFNPSKGWQVDLDGSIGARKIVENAKIVTLLENSEIQNPYDTLIQEQNVVRLQSSVKKFSRIIQRFVLFNEIQIGWLQYNREKNVRVNGDEGFRIGGIRNIRGFDEEAILTDRYGFFKNELRWLWDQRSNVFVFQDFLYSNDIVDLVEQSKRFRYGFGFGVSLHTASGIFTISYALGGVRGSEQNEHISPKFRNAKVHFGYNIYF